MVKLVDTLSSGGSAARCGGSNPLMRTLIKAKHLFERTGAFFVTQTPTLLEMKGSEKSTERAKRGKGFACIHCTSRNEELESSHAHSDKKQSTCSKEQVLFLLTETQITFEELGTKVE